MNKGLKIAIGIATIGVLGTAGYFIYKAIKDKRDESNTPPPPPPPPRPEQYQREEVVSNSMPTSEEDQIFNIGTTNDALTVDLEDLDEEQKNDLSLLNEIETVE